jgi:ADP-ribose pyrophosphatase YjhB (NUDIX family)
MADRPKTMRERQVLRVFHWWFLLSRPMTLGVRAIVLDGEDRVLLVRHTYVPGWHFPGGGVERGETLLTSLARELAEEANIALEGEPALHGMFFNRAVSSRDHIAVYVVRAFRQTAPRQADREIAEARFFPCDALPDGAGRATRARLAETLDGAPLTPFW